MLVVHPTSSCDVCLEPYGTGPKSPHSITCGHVFCLGCLESITSGACPLCRERFYPMDTRRLHIDLDSQGLTPPAKCPTDEASHQARVLQDSIARIVKDGSSEAHLRALIEECGAFLKTQERCQHEDLRVSFRMISYLCEVKSGLKKQLEHSTKLAQEREALRAQLATELEAAETRYQELLQTSTDERETALAVENSLREHYKQVLQRCEEAENECDRLSQEIEHLRTDPLNALRTRPQELRKRNIPFPTDDDMLAAMTKAKKLLDKPDKETFYLSPLPESLGPLSSSLKSFAALPEVDYDSEKTKILEEDPDEEDEGDDDDDEDEDEDEEEDKPALSQIPDLIISIPDSLRLATEPLLQSKPPILRSKTEPIPKVTGGLSLTAPTDSDTHDYEPSRPPMRFPALQITSRSSCHSSPSPFNPPRSATYPQRPSQTTPKRDSYTRDRGRSFVSAQNEPEQLRSQLHDLLSNPVSSSLPNISHFPSIVTVPTPPSSPSSRSSSSGSQRRPALRSPVSIKPPPAPMTITPPPPPPPTHASHGALIVQRPAMSTASSAALALEKERQKVEQERQKEKERQNAERRHLSPSASSNSLREPGNLHFISSVQSSGTRRDLTNVYGTSTISGSSGSLRETFDGAHGLSHVDGTSSLRETNLYVNTPLRRQHSAVHGKRRINLQGLFT